MEKARIGTRQRRIALGTPSSTLSGGGGGVGVTGWGNGKILNGHIFVNTHQNCIKFSAVVYCVDIELITRKKVSKYKISLCVQ